MPIRFATKSGSWSDTTVWDNGALPQAGDDVYANGFSVTIDQNVNVGSIRNTASPVTVPNIATPAMTSNFAPSGIVTASGTTSGYQPYFAFAQDGRTTHWYSNTNNSGWLSYQFPSPKTIARYGFSVLGAGFAGGANTAPATWTFQGSNDGSAWTTLDSKTGQNLAEFSFNSYAIASPASFVYYRINVTANKASNVTTAIAEFEMTESTGTVFGGTAGGSFTLNGGVTVTLTGTTPTSAAGSPLFTYAAAAGNTSTITALNGTMFFNTQATGFITHSGTGTLTINGNLTETNIGNNNNNGIVVSGGGTLNYNGIFTTSVPYTSKQFIVVSSAATVNFTGTMNVVISSNNSFGSQLITCSNAGATINIIGNIVTSGNNVQATTTFAAISASAGTINMTGSITGSGISFFNNGIVALSGGANFYLTGSVTGGTNFNMITHTGTGIVSITGPVTSTGNANVVSCSGANTLTITGTCTASTSAPAVFSSSTSATNTFTGPFVSNTNVMAVQVAKLLLTTTPTYWRFQSDARTMYTADYNPDYPSTLNVRSGTSYGSGMTGTMVVPAANTVATGVPVGNTVGTAANSATAVQDAVWGKLTSTMTTADSIGERVKNALTQDTLGNLLTSL